MNKIRVLHVDDSVVVRTMLTNVISADSDMEVVGVAANGRIGLSKIHQNHPDLVVMDVEMPEMGGLEALREIRRLWPRLPVIMFSSLTLRSAAVTLDALELGANDYVTKPVRVDSAEQAEQHIKQDLISKIRACADAKGSPRDRSGSIPAARRLDRGRATAPGLSIPIRSTSWRSVPRQGDRTRWRRCFLYCRPTSPCRS